MSILRQAQNDTRFVVPYCLLVLPNPDELALEQKRRSIEETSYLLSVPGMRESIQSGMREPISECSTTIDL